MRRKNEYLWEQAIHDWDRMKAAHQESLTTWFADLIRALKPTIVHSHHYAHMGMEHLRIIKQIGRAHVCNPVTNAHLVCRLLLEKKKKYNYTNKYVTYYKI